MVQEGFIYFLERKGNDLHMSNYIPMASLFKVFVDPEDEKIRLVAKMGNTLTNFDLLPLNFIIVMGMINQ